MPAKRTIAAQNEGIAETIRREQPRLRSFIRKRVADAEDAEDVLQDVFQALVEANRLMQPIEEVGAWLFRVARNRIIDGFRKKRPLPLPDTRAAGEDEEIIRWEDLLPSPGEGPDAVYARQVLIEELEEALDELPEEQRYAFVAHELEGRSFKEMAEETGVGVNTLLSRKHYAVIFLRKRLRAIHDQFANKRG